MLVRSMLLGGGVLLFTFANAFPARASEFECDGAAMNCPVRCGGDDTACTALYIRQDGKDRDSGAHVILKFSVSPDHKPQSMDLVLSLGEKSSDCKSGAAHDVNANANNNDGRSIDGYLCGLRATWTRN